MPQIDNHTSSDLSLGTIAVLQVMFSDYARLVIKHDFSAMGYSGSWIYLIHPFKESGGYDLPVVVKVASISLIQKESQAYKHHIRRKWLGIAHLRDDPTFLEEQHLAGLCYQLIGGNIFKPQSLHKYCLSPHTSVNDIHFVLNKRLFQIIKKRVIHPSSVQFDYPLQAVYDMVLPVNLLLLPEAIPSNEHATLITPTQLPDALLEEGCYVRLEGFVVTKVDLRDQTVTLNLPSGRISHSYRVRIQSIEGLQTYHFNQVLPPFEGVVVENSASRFAAEVAKIGIHDPTSAMITLPDGRQEANPLLMMPEILAKTRHLKFNTIHGDLNLENVLIDPAIRDISLIDFSEARYGYVLHDLLHLEMEIITKLLPDAFSKANLAPEYVFNFYQALHHAMLNFDDQSTVKSFSGPLEKPFMILKEIRQVAREGLYDRQDVTEYYDGLLLYLLGAVRFTNLSRKEDDQESGEKQLNPKELVFYAATAIHKLMTTPPKTEIEIQWIQPANSVLQKKPRSFDFFFPKPKSFNVLFTQTMRDFLFLQLDLKQQLKEASSFIYLITFTLAFILLLYLIYFPRSI